MEFRKILNEIGFKIENSTKDSNQLYIFNARLSLDEEVVYENDSFPKKFWN